MATERKGPSETLTDTLIERVDKLVLANKRTAPITDAVAEPALRIDALEAAVREIARDVQKHLSAQR